MRALVIIPCYNEAKNICAVVEDIKSNNREIDYLIINDCSTDETEEICRQNGYNYISLPINLGIGGCMQTGYKYALEMGYDIAIQHDGDGQHDPRYFDTVISPVLACEADFVIGSRFLTNEGFRSSPLRRFGITLLSGMLRLCAGVKIFDVTSGYRAVGKNCIELFTREYAQDYPEPESILSAVRCGARVKEVPVVMRSRTEGESSIGAWGACYYMIKVSVSLLLNRFLKKIPPAVKISG